MLLIALYVPLAVMAVYSLNDSFYFGEWKGFTIKWYKQLFNDTEVAIALKNSLLVAMASAIISVALAVPAALAGTRHTHGLASILIYPPVIIPEITEAVALMLMLLLLGFPLGVLSVLIGHTAFNVAYAYIAISPIAGRGKELADTARTLGADPRTAF